MERWIAMVPWGFNEVVFHGGFQMDVACRGKAQTWLSAYLLFHSFTSLYFF